MNSKIGRPKIDNPKSIRYSVRLNEELEKKINEYAKKNNLSKGEVIRLALEKFLA